MKNVNETKEEKKNASSKWKKNDKTSSIAIFKKSFIQKLEHYTIAIRHTTDYTDNWMDDWVKKL